MSKVGLEESLARASLGDDRGTREKDIENSDSSNGKPVLNAVSQGMPDLPLDKAPLCAKLKIDELLFTFFSSEPQRKQLLQLVKDFEMGSDLSDYMSSPVSPRNSGGGGASPALGSPVLSPLRRAAPTININSSASLSVLSGAAGLASPPRSPRSPRSGNGGFSSPRSGESIEGASPRSPRRKSPLQHSLGITRPLSLEADAPTSSATPKSNKSHKKGPLLSSPKKKFVIPRVMHPRSTRARNRLEERISVEELDNYFSPEGSILTNDFVHLCKDVCGFPTFFNGSLCRRIRLLWSRKLDKERDSTENKDHASQDTCHDNIEDEEQENRKDESVMSITKEQFLYFWATEMEPYDEMDRFFRLVKEPDSNFITAPDFTPFLEELLAYHPGLEFLENTPEFQEKYARTVIARIFYEVNVSWNGQITRRELCRSDLLKVCHMVDEEEDINTVLRFFSYEHFYTLYVKFWEIDTDHDFLVSKEDLLRHGGHSLTPAIVERIFEQPVYKFFSGIPDKMGFEDFVFFFLSEEDKTSKVSLRYWFSCIDLDGDGTIQAWEMRRFYAQQISRLQSYGQEVIPFADVLCQAHDFVHPENEGYWVLSDFTNPAVIHISGALFNILFNLNKFMAFEQRDPFYMRQQHENPHLTDWDRYAAVEYARLASAEEKRENEEEHFATWGVDDDLRGGLDGGRNGSSSWLQYNESPF